MAWLAPSGTGWRLSCNARNQSLHPIGDERAGPGRCAWCGRLHNLRCNIEAKHGCCHLLSTHGLDTGQCARLGTVHPRIWVPLNACGHDGQVHAHRGTKYRDEEGKTPMTITILPSRRSRAKAHCHVLVFPITHGTTAHLPCVDT